MADKRERGLFGKFIVKRADGTHREGEKHDGCQYFVLDVTHDPHAGPALWAYAESAEADGYHTLAADLRRLAAPPTEEAAGCTCGRWALGVTDPERSHLAGCPALTAPRAETGDGRV